MRRIIKDICAHARRFHVTSGTIFFFLRHEDKLVRELICKLLQKELSNGVAVTAPNAP